MTPDYFPPLNNYSWIPEFTAGLLPLVTMTYNVAIVGTGIFATNAHLPAIQKNELLTPVSCYNRTAAKAQAFAALNEPALKVYKELDEVFADPEVDVVDALLPVQYNLDAVKRAVASGKNIAIEKPIAANIEQAREIVKLAKANPEIIVAVNEHWVFLKAASQIKAAMAKIGNVVGFNYHSTGPFNFNNQYMTTAWRQHPEHIGGFLSDGGVHQLGLLTTALGAVAEVNARTLQVREASGDVDVVWGLFKMESGVVGSFNYGSAFGSKEKKGYFEILGDNGSIYYDFSKVGGDRLVVKTGGLNADDALTNEEIHIENENWSVDAEFHQLALVLDGKADRDSLCLPETAFHHLAIVAALLESSQNDGATTKPPSCN